MCRYQYLFTFIYVLLVLSRLTMANKSDDKSLPMDHQAADADVLITEQTNDDGRSKRKGSPLTNSEPVKKPVSTYEGLRRRNSFPDVSKILETDKPDKKKNKTKAMAFSDMMKMTFDDQAFKNSITPILYDMVCPLIHETIKSTVSSTVTAAIDSFRSSVIDQMIRSNRDLQESVKEQSRIINEQKAVIEEQRAIINDNNDTIDGLYCQVHVLSTEVDELKFDINELEQYGRRNSLRINNLKLDSPMGPPNNEQALTTAVVQFLNTAVLKSAGNLAESDIERCHFVGKPKASGAQQILVKFFRYHDKQKVFACKENLKNNSNKTFLTEDQTSINHSVIKSLLPLKKDGKIDSFWTRDGKILVKKDRYGNPVRLSPKASVTQTLGLASPTGVTGASPV